MTYKDKLRQLEEKSVYVVEENGRKVNNIPKINSLTTTNHLAPIGTKLEMTDRLGTIAPSSKKKKKGWFKTGAFEDGYQFGDVTKTILGTAGDIGVNTLKGLTYGAEGVVDAGRYGLATAADWMGFDKYAESVRNRAKQNTTETIFGKPEKFFDKNSIMDEKADSIAQGVGNVGFMYGTAGLGKAAGLGSKGMGAVTTGSTFTSGMGNGMSEAYEGGATDKEAATYGVISGTAEALTEMMFGGLGKGAGTIGISRGMSSADDMLAKKLSSKFKSQLAKNLTEYGIKSTAEGMEEVTSGIMEAFGKKLTYMSDEDIGTLLKNEKLLDQFISGTITSGIVQSGYIPGTSDGSLKTANKTKTDFITGYTANEQKVVDSLIREQTNERLKQIGVDSEVNKAIQEKETEQKGKLSHKEKTALTEAIKKKIDNGEIQPSINKISNKEITKIQEEIENKLQKGQLDVNKIEEILGNKALDSDNLLQKSYQETAKKSEKFTFDESNIKDEFEKSVYESATKNMNNTERSHEFVQKVAKLASEKQTNYGFINNDELKSLGHDIEGKEVGGLVRTNDDGQKTVLINIDSSKALNSIVGHETTHLLEGTTEYKELQESIFEYAKQKGDFNERQKTLNELYEGIENADINSEITADLVGDYLFTDEKFINSLSMNKPTVFEKIKNLIDDLVVKFTGTKEEKLLREVQKKFKEAYKQNGNLENNKYMMIGKNGVKTGIQTNEKYNDIKDRYFNAVRMERNNASNEEIRQQTGWFKDNKGNWEFEISDRNTKFKEKPETNKTYKLTDIFDASTLYELYPELKDMKVEFKKNKSLGNYSNETKTITISNKLLSDLDSARGTLLHEIQHYIQRQEGFPTGTTIKFGNAHYANRKGEIEAADVKNRRNLTVKQRKNIIPESAKENPVHPNREAILNHKRNFVEKLAEKLYNKYGDKIDGVDQESFLEDIRKTSESMVETFIENSGINEELDDSSFSLSQDNQGRKLSEQQQEYFKDSKIRDKNG